MYFIKRKNISFHKIWIGALLIGLVVALSLSASLAPYAHAAPASSESPPLDLLQKGGKAKWLYAGVIRLENKTASKHWDYGWDETTKAYVLDAAGECEEGKPNDYIKAVGGTEDDTPYGNTADEQMTRYVVEAAGDGQGNFCSQATTPLTMRNQDRANALFYQYNNKPNKVEMWNGAATFTKKKTTAAGWSAVYYRDNDGSDKCFDIIGKKTDGTWVFFPTIEWTEGVKDDYGFIDGAKSQDHAALTGAAAYDNCRVASFEVINIFKTGIKNGEYLDPASDYKLYTSWDVWGGDDNPVQLCGDKSKDTNILILNDLPKYIDIEDAIHDEDRQDRIKKDWPDGEPSDGYNWALSCERTDSEGGDWAHHNIRIWDTKSYGMTESSNRRLLDLSHAGLYSFVGGGDAANDGYKVQYGVAQLTPDEASDVNPDVNIDPPSDDEDPTEEGTTCAVDGVGWIVCPVMTFLAKLNDSAFAFLKSMLEIRPALITDNSTQNAWAAFRDIANVAFVIAFIVIVYSQLTSVGISNYGIKRMLPRLFIAAILVNVSYWICAAMVDLSNIVGGSIYSLLGTSIDVGTAPGGGTGETWSDIMAVVLAVAAGILLVIVVILAPTVLLALAVILMILVARQALVIMLIVLSPLAFVAYLLPNTEDWFKKWWKMLVATLMVFPLVGLVFGASTLASTILMNVAGGGSGDDEQLLKIVALAVLAIPLFAVPSLLIGAMSAAGSIGNKLSNLSNRANRSAMNKGKTRFDKSALGQYRNYRSQRRDTRRAMTQAGKYEATKPWQKPRQWASKAQGALYGSQASGAFGDRIVAHGTALADKEWDEEVARQKTSMTGLSHTQLMEIMKDSSSTAEKRAAAAGTIMGRDFRAGHLEALQAAGELGKTADKDIGSIQKQMAHDMKDKPFALGDQAAGQLGIGRYGKKTDLADNPQQPLGDLNSEFKDRLGNKLSASGLASMNPDELKLAHKMATTGQLDSVQLGNLQRSIAAARTDDRLKVLIKPEAEKLHNEIMGQTLVGSGGGTIDEASQMNIQHDQDVEAMQNALGGMEGENPSTPRNPPQG